MVLGWCCCCCCCCCCCFCFCFVGAADVADDVAFVVATFATIAVVDLFLLSPKSGFRPNNHFSKSIKLETNVVNNCLFVVFSMLIPVFRQSPVNVRI